LGFYLKFGLYRILADSRFGLDSFHCRYFCPQEFGGEYLKYMIYWVVHYTKAG